MDQSEDKSMTSSGSTSSEPRYPLITVPMVGEDETGLPSLLVSVKPCVGVGWVPTRSRGSVRKLQAETTTTCYRP